jgi:hypothetical protein
MNKLTKNKAISKIFRDGNAPKPILTLRKYKSPVKASFSNHLSETGNFDISTFEIKESSELIPLKKNFSLGLDSNLDKMSTQVDSRDFNSPLDGLTTRSSDELDMSPVGFEISNAH